MFLLIDKPKGITSHDVVDRVREITGERKVGHAGTLDPNATGLLVLGIRREATRELGKISKATKKIYEAEIYLGEERDTDDIEGIVVSKVKGFLAPSKNEVVKVLASFIGKQSQKPPIFSAIKIRGKKAYELARKGRKVEIKPRRIVVYSIDLIDYKFPSLAIRTKVSSGTYIRAVARDIGDKLGLPTYLKYLCRNKIADISLERNFFTDGRQRLKPGEFRFFEEYNLIKPYFFNYILKISDSEIQKAKVGKKFESQKIIPTFAFQDEGSQKTGNLLIYLNPSQGLLWSREGDLVYLLEKVQWTKADKADKADKAVKVGGVAGDKGEFHIHELIEFLGEINLEYLYIVKTEKENNNGKCDYRYIDNFYLKTEKFKKEKSIKDFQFIIPVIQRYKIKKNLYKYID